MSDRFRIDSQRFKADLSSSLVFRNDSGEAIPAYGCIKLISYDAGTDRYSADKPDGSEGLYFVNGPVPVATGKYGRGCLWSSAQIGLVDDGALGDEVGPQAGQWEMSTTSSLGGFRIFNNPVSGKAVLLQIGGAGGGGPAGTMDVKPVTCLGQGYYRAEVGSWGPDVPPDGGGGSGGSGGSGSGASDPCNICDVLEEIEGFECGDSGIPPIPRDSIAGSGVYVIIYDPFPLPLKMGKHAIVALPGVPYVSGSGGLGGSGSGETDGLVYKVLNGVYETVVIPHEKWECCTDPITGEQTVQRIECTSFIVLGVACITEPTPCPTSGGGGGGGSGSGA